MKNKYIAIAAFVAMSMISCGGAEEAADKATDAIKEAATETVETAKEEVTETIEEVAEAVTTADYSAGEEIYGKTCKACHQGTGAGIPGAFPPLAESDYLLEDKIRAIKQILNGSSEEMVVNGVTYNGTMTPQNLEDQEVVDVLNYVLNSWGNAGGEVTLEDVAAAK